MMMMSVDTTSTSTPQPPPVATAAGWLAVLQEQNQKEPALVTAALRHLLDCVDALWHEIAEALPDLEALAEEGSSSSNSKAAAAVASRVLFYLGERPAALNLALTAGSEYFRVSAKSNDPYATALTATALDAYIAARQRGEEEGEGEVLKGETTTLTAAQLQPVVYELLEAAVASHNYRDAIGICLEARELEPLQRILLSSTEKDLSQYALTALQSSSDSFSKQFRTAALQVVCARLEEESNSNSSNEVYYSLVLCYQWLHQPEKVALVLHKLLLLLNNNSDVNKPLTALQLAFDLQDSGDQAFCAAVSEALEKTEEKKSSQTENTAKKSNEFYDNCQKVLTGGFASELALSFLFKSSAADPLVMEHLKSALEERGARSSSLLHNAAVLTHSYLNAGTTNDSFLRNHLEWMKKASNWAKFSATASLGVVHAGHVTEAMSLLEPYLPPNPEAAEGAAAAVSPTGGYAEGGSLYALGLIHSSSAGGDSAAKATACTLLRSHLRASHANEVQSHGAALAVGLTAMGSADLTILNELKEVLDTDSAVAGEAAGIAMGLVLVGTGAGNTHNTLGGSTENDDAQEIAELVAELKNYARETQHEKIIRGIGLGLALMNFGQEENADAAIEELRSDRDPVLRYGAQYALALAYCGTGSNKAIRILLHTAVSDVSDDVRMAAVIGLAFVLFKTPERVPQLVKLLLESFNPHVRYASCMAVGIAMAGSGDAESIAMLEPMLEDMTDYVRQGALIGTAMIYMQQSDTANGRRIRSFREKLSTLVSEKHQSALTKMGAILSIGIIDAGGRNCSLALGSRNGFTKMSSCVGLALWLQHWHWYPMMHMFSLALTPTLTIGLNKDFKYPKNFSITCHAKPSQFAYPKKLEEKKEKEKKRVETVMLSTTAKEKARLARKAAKLGEKDGAASMDVGSKDESNKKASETTASKDQAAKEGDDKEKDAMDVDKDQEEEPASEKKPKKKREPEPAFFSVGNPARITVAQSQFCEFDLTQRYRPVRPDEKPFGVIILTDSTPDEEEEDLGAVKAPSLEPEGELAPPEPFEWTPPPRPSKASEENKKEESDETKVSSE